MFKSCSSQIGGSWSLCPPETPEVQSYLANNGSSTSLLDVALDILRRHADMLGNDRIELLFVRDCLQYDRSVLSWPYALHSEYGSEEIGDFLMSSSAPCNPAMTSMYGSKLGDLQSQVQEAKKPELLPPESKPSQEVCRVPQTGSLKKKALRDPAIRCTARSRTTIPVEPASPPPLFRPARRTVTWAAAPALATDESCKSPLSERLPAEVSGALQEECPHKGSASILKARNGMSMCADAYCMELSNLSTSLIEAVSNQAIDAARPSTELDAASVETASALDLDVQCRRSQSQHKTGTSIVSGVLQEACLHQGPASRWMARRENPTREDSENSTCTASLTLSSLIDNLDRWGAFDVFEVADATIDGPLQVVGREALLRCDAMEACSIHIDKTCSFLRHVENLYEDMNAVPYHNAAHAADVVQSVHAFLFGLEFGNFFNDHKRFSLILSGIIHDVGHDGRNNAFHMAMRDELAITYNDQSILENYHASLGFRLLLVETSTNILADLNQELLVQTRKEMILAVLATDMALHMGKVSILKSIVERCATDSDDWIAEDEYARQELLSMVLHAADISSSSKPSILADRWANLLKDEFFRQGDEERRLGFPVSPLCDRHTVKFASSQIGFMNFVVKPMFVLLGGIAPKVNTEVIKLVDSNLLLWEGRKTLELVDDAVTTKVMSIGGVREIKRFLGKGAFASVFECVIDSVEADVALKLLDGNVPRDIDREVQVMKDLRHTNIVRLFDFIPGSLRHPAALVLELCNGGALDVFLHETVRDTDVCKVPHRFLMILELASAVEYLHSQHIVHRDIKPANIYLVEQWSAANMESSRLPLTKLGDMGLSRFVTSATAMPMTACTGTPAYMAPENLSGQTHYSLPCDIFSVAIVIHEIMAVQVPYSTVANLKDVRTGIRICQGLRPPLAALPHCQASHEISNILQKSWCSNPGERITADDLKRRLDNALHMMTP